MQSIESALAALPRDLLNRSGSVFYSGRSAFDSRVQVYLLGLNPGGDPNEITQTVEASIVDWQSRSEPYAAYLDEEWGKGGPSLMQRGVRHLFERLGLDLRQVPTSNAIFARTRDEAGLSEKQALLEACWPVHHAIISELQPRVIICLGGTCGSWVRNKLGATDHVASFSETNDRGWTSWGHVRPGSGDPELMVFELSHPSRMDWCNPASDPSEWVKHHLDQFPTTR